MARRNARHAVQDAARDGARHAAPRRRGKVAARVGLVATAAGIALGAAAGGAGAADEGTSVGDVDSAASAQALTDAVGFAVAPAKDLRLDPFAGTSVDPLDNAVGTQLADFKPVSSALLTGPIASGGSVEDVPVVGRAAGVLPG
ncbi:hypothetical protein ACIBI4_09575 [Streptomyces sp. NPDC050418]|uniref:hypothetical protein n=1 Tax=Streptomyces sp. NPDC050418 TaxID=3365612 RepID=UPI0037B04C4F